jgi:hypothetical protein
MWSWRRLSGQKARDVKLICTGVYGESLECKTLPAELVGTGILVAEWTSMPLLNTVTKY